MKISPEVLERDWTGLAVIASGTSWSDTWLSEKHLAIELSKHRPVLFVDPAMSFLTPIRKPALRRGADDAHLRLVGENLARLTPMTVPGITRPGSREIGERMTRRAIRRTVRLLGATPVAYLVGSLDDVFTACDAELRVLYGTDDWSAGAELLGKSLPWILRRERLQLRRADRVIAVSESLAERWAGSGPPISVIPNGCDTASFATSDTVERAPEITLPSPIVGFIGHLSDRIDLAMLEAVADRGHSLLLVGPRQLTFSPEKVEALLRRPNVQWVGPQPFERLPAFMRAIDVGVTPYTRSRFNLASDPLKTLEYLAAGRPAVSSDLPAVRRFPDGLVAVAADPESFANAVDRALLPADDAHAPAKRRAYARSQNWAARAGQVELLIAGRDSS